MKEVIETKQAPQAIGPYSQARMSGGVLVEIELIACSHNK
ncbi:hypothetical protein SPSIL_056200 [Sporomusa silvacetica DSM 10669]|uniref:Uncharacterized protein n=1 Tax=Sporomusa silvacetica DSM 10669 TaxID=1123289 RepID=A0ABZ3IUH4_9FIRM|nr:hypothetical protein SPSIL_57150 [Sporomusa silvacetica DSM 10669]